MSVAITQVLLLTRSAVHHRVHGSKSASNALPIRTYNQLTAQWPKVKYRIPGKDATLYPPVLLALESIESEKLEAGSKYYHPADTFLLAFTDAVECLSRVATKVEHEMELQFAGVRSLSASGTVERMDGIRLDVFSMIFHCGNFIEACQTTIKTIFHDDKEKAAKAAKEFNRSTESYRGHVSKIINEIKHKHRRIRVFSATWDLNIIIGFYVEGVVDINVIGPDPLVHKRHNLMSTGFSLNWEIQNHLVNMYHASGCLESALRNFKPFATNTTIESGIASNSALNERLSKHLNDIAAIPALYLPNEFVGSQYSVVKKGENYLLSNGKDKKPLNNKPHPMNISLSSRIGLFNLGIEMPYYLPQEITHSIL